MEVRKIQLIGSSSYMISLPKRWITANNLKQGDEVVVHAQGDRVVVIPKRDEKDKLVRIVMKGVPKSDEEFLRRYIYAIYMLGFDEVVIEAPEIPTSMTTRLVEITQKLAGMELIDVSPARLVFRILITPELDIETVLRRMVQMVNAMFDMAIEAVRGQSDMRNLMTAEESVDRFYWLAVRLENRMTRESTSWSQIRFVLGSRMVAKMIEDMADKLVVFARYAGYEGGKADGMVKFLSEIRETFNSTFESFTTRNLEMADESIKAVEEVQRAIERAVDEEKEVGRALAMRTLLEITDEVKSIAEIAVNRAVREMAEAAERS